MACQRIVRAGSVIALLSGIFWLAPLPVLAADYYVHPTSGTDSGPGSKSRPFRTIARINALNPNPGDRILFARGMNFTGALVIRASGSSQQPIIVTAYGAGTAPRLLNPRFGLEKGRIVSVYGAHVVVENLYLYDTPTPPPDDPPLGWKESHQHKLVTEMAAVFVDRDASYVVVRNCEFVNTPIGIRLRGQYSKALNNYLHDASKITEYWGAIAIAVVGPHNEVAYNRIENIGYYGGAYVDDGAAVELDGEDQAFDAHHTNVHHNISRNTKGGFLEIAGNTHDVEIAYNVSDDVDKFVGTNGIANLSIMNNTIIRQRIPDISADDFWSFRSLLWSICFNGCEGDRDSNVMVAGNVFVTTAIHRIYLGVDNPNGFMSARHRDNLYFSPDGDGARLLGQPLGPGEQITPVSFRNPGAWDYRLIGASGFGAYKAGEPLWHAGLTRNVGGVGRPD